MPARPPWRGFGTSDLAVPAASGGVIRARSGVRSTLENYPKVSGGQKCGQDRRSGSKNPASSSPGTRQAWESTVQSPGRAVVTQNYPRSKVASGPVAHLQPALALGSGMLCREVQWGWLWRLSADLAGGWCGSSCGSTAPALWWAVPETGPVGACAPRDTGPGGRE